MTSFSERQKFTQWWLWLLIIASLVVPLVLTVIKARNVHMALSPVDILIGCSVPAMIVVLFLVITLITRIDDTGIYYRFIPVHFKMKKIGWDEVEKAYIRTYSPLREYGGWGIRKGMGSTGSALNISGNTGLQLELKNGKKILIGTSRPQEITQLLEARKKTK